MRLGLIISVSLGVLALSAPAEAQITATPPAVMFPDTGTGATSKDVTVNLKNTSMGQVTIKSVSFTGAHPNDFVDNSLFPPPLTLAAGAGVDMVVAFKPTAGGQRTANYAVLLDNNMTVNVPLSGKAIGPKIEVSPNPIEAGGSKVGVATPPVTVTVTNAGGGLINVSNLALSGPNVAEFTLAGSPNFPAFLQPGASFKVTVTFKPTGTGVRSASLTVTSDDPNNPNLVTPVRGTAGDPLISLSVGSMVFGNARVGVESPKQKATISNSGFSDLNVTFIALDGNNAGDFILDKGKLPTKIIAGGSEDFHISCKPTMIGQRQARVVITSNDPINTNKFVGVLCNGTTSMLKVSMNSCDFMQQKIYVASKPCTIAVQNTGSDFANVQMLPFTGKEAGWFRVAGAKPMFPLKVPPMGELKLDVVAVPLGLGKGAGVLTINTDDPKTAMFAIPLTVEGVGASISVDPQYVDFGAVGFGFNSQPIIVKLTNTGTDKLAIESFMLQDMSNTITLKNDPMMLPLEILPGKDTSFEVTFKPQVAGPVSAEIQLTTDDPMARNVRIPINGIGAQAGLMVSPTVLDFGSLLVNTSSLPLSVTINNTGGAPLEVTQVALKGAAPGSFSVDDTGPLTIPGMKSRVLHVTFGPVNGGAAAADLVITPKGFMPNTVKLRGTGVAAMLQVALPGGGNVLDFGDVELGQEATLQFGVKNISGLTLDLAVASTKPTFAIDTMKSTLKLTHEGTTTVDVTFKPAAVGVAMGNITIGVKGSPGTLQTINLAGNGVGMRAVRKPGGCSVARNAGQSANGLPLLALLLAPVMMLAVRRRRRR